MFDTLGTILTRLGDMVAWSSLFSLVSFIVVLSIIVFVHEFGHFIVGRWCGVGVREFSIGFGRELFGWTDRKGTRWKVSLLPLGGYVRFVGDLNAASMPDGEEVDGMTPEERAISFPRQSVGKRAAIIAAGPLANFIFSIVIFAGFFMAYGKTVLEPRIDEVIVGGRAEAAGLKAGDLILSIDGSKVVGFPDVVQHITLSPERPLQIRVQRAGAEVSLTATPKLEWVTTPVGPVEAGQLGFKVNAQLPERWHAVSFGPMGAVVEGGRETWSIISQSLTTIGKLITGQVSFKQLSGPVGIGQMTGHVAGLGMLALVGYVAFLSVSIGMVNLLPVPVLDGGHLVFCAIEAIRRRPLDERIQEIAFRLGFALILTLIVVVSWNDLTRIFVSSPPV